MVIRSRISRIALVIVAVLAIATLVMVLIALRAPQYPALPNPNGYDDLQNAGKLVKGRFDDLDELDHSSLRNLVSNNAAPLRLLRIGLSRQVAVPTQAAIENFPSQSRELVNLKHLAMLLAAEGRLAELENRPADAARSYADAIHLGAVIGRGGFMIDRLVSVACEGIGITHIAKLLPKLNPQQIRPLISELERIDTNTVAWSEVLKGEDLFARDQMRKNPNPFEILPNLRIARVERRETETRHNIAVASLRLLMTELALRSFRSETGTSPQHLQDLVPRYLKRVPIDPFSNSPLIYTANRTNHLLYSIGPDRVDDGGTPLAHASSRSIIGFEDSNSSMNKGDLFYNSRW